MTLTELAPGPEMDAVVWKALGHKVWWEPSEYAWPAGYCYSAANKTVTPVPPVSTDLAAAWRVVEAMRKQGWRYFLMETEDCRHRCSFNGHGRIVQEFSDTPAEAISRAALKALGT